MLKFKKLRKAQYGGSQAFKRLRISKKRRRRGTYFGVWGEIIICYGWAVETSMIFSMRMKNKDNYQGRRWEWKHFVELWRIVIWKILISLGHGLRGSGGVWWNKIYKKDLIEGLLQMHDYNSFLFILWGTCLTIINGNILNR